MINAANMKFTAAICTFILATSVSAVTVADPFCYYIGEPCSKVKRAAEAVAEAFAEPNAATEADANAEAFCHFIGEPCSKAKRAADALAAAVAEAQPNPVAYYNSLMMRDAFPSPNAEPEAGKFDTSNSFS
jgi:hypothetical protein